MRCCCCLTNALMRVASFSIHIFFGIVFVILTRFLCINTISCIACSQLTVYSSLHYYLIMMNDVISHTHTYYIVCSICSVYSFHVFTVDCLFGRAYTHAHAHCSIEKRAFMLILCFSRLRWMQALSVAEYEK